MHDSEKPGNDGPSKRLGRFLGRITVSRGTVQQLDQRVRTVGLDLGARARTAVTGLSAVVRSLSVPISAVFFVAPPTSAARTRSGTSSRPDMPPPSVPPQVRIIANPVSGGSHSPAAMRELEETVRWLGARGLPAELRLTDGPGRARQLAEEAVKAGMRMVVAAGGDGTINEVIQALAGHTTALGVLPFGTVNVWAREMNIPLALSEARRVLVEGVRRRTDLGRAGTRYFLLMAGIGIDAEVARRVEHRPLKRMGLKVMDYIATGSVVSVTQRPVRVWVQRGSRRRGRHAVQILIGNTRLFAGAFTFTRRAVADDGWLDVVFVGGRRLRHRAQVLARAVLRRPTLGPHAHYERVRAIRLDAETPLPVQVDGEVIGALPMTFAVYPRALTVIVPADAPAELFMHPPLAE
jgi:diacylglycerol kinase (ATP)